MNPNFIFSKIFVADVAKSTLDILHISLFPMFRFEADAPRKHTFEN